ncbi:MAG: hypothetical protein JRE40_00305 [Deltaproteobacteria bacterium]|nr:hypothetical protein [Deltaproteobacteria bacterium]
MTEYKPGPFNSPQRPTDLSQEVYLQKLEKRPDLIREWRRGILTETEFFERLDEVKISKKFLSLRNGVDINFDISEDYGQADPAFQSAPHDLSDVTKLMDWAATLVENEGDQTLALEWISEYFDGNLTLSEITKKFKSRGWIDKSVTKRSIKKGRNHSSIYNMVYRALDKYKILTREELIRHLSPTLTSSKRPAAAIRQAIRRGLEREFFTTDMIDGEVYYTINMNRPYKN